MPARSEYYLTVRSKSMAGPSDPPQEGVVSYAAKNVFSGPGFQNNAPIAQLNQYINDTESTKAQWLRDLFITDPYYDKKRIEDSSGGLLPDSCNWILLQPTFQQWLVGTDSRVLWVKGGPGTGKTMLLCFIIDHLTSHLGENDSLSYFFCERSNRETSNACAVLRGLSYMLITRSQTPRKGLLESVEDESHAAGLKAALDGPGAWYSLEHIFRKLLREIGNRSAGSSKSTVYLLVDALDECSSENFHNFLKFAISITQQEDNMPHVRWLLTSRGNSGISKILGVGRTETRQSLDLDYYPEERTRALDAYVDHYAKELVETHNGLVGSAEIRRQLRGKVDKRRDSFLYTSLLVAEARRATTSEQLHKVLANAALNVRGLYEQAADRISHLDEELRCGCVQVLTAVTTAYRPLHYSELCTLASIDSGQTMSSILRECDIFFTISNIGTAQFVNRSAKSFLSGTGCTLLFSSSNNLYSHHHFLFINSLAAMEKLLRRDICELAHPGFATVDVTPEQQELLGGVGYACEYWVEHLVDSKCQSEDDLKSESVVIHTFLKGKFANWVESMSLLRSGRTALSSWGKLVAFLRRFRNTASLVELATDAQCFLEFNAQAIMEFPLQVYTSALVFAPTQSRMRDLLSVDEPGWVTISDGMERQRWSPWSRTLIPPPGQELVVTKSATFSSNGTWVAALLRRAHKPGLLPGQPYSEVVVWELETAAYRWSLPGAQYCIGFPTHRSLLAVSIEGTVRFWDLTQGCWDDTKRLQGLNPTCAGFSPDGIWLAAVTGEHANRVEVWDWERGDQALVLGGTGTGGGDAISSLAFSSSNGALLATADSRGVSVWNYESGCRLWGNETNETAATAISFSSSAEHLVISASCDMLTAWNWRENLLVRKLELGGSRSLQESGTAVAVSADGSRLAVAPISMVKVWDATTRRRLQTLRGFDKYVRSLAFSPDGSHLASGGRWGLKICLTGSTEPKDIQEDRDHKGRIQWVKVTGDGRRIVSISVDSVSVWNAASGSRVARLEVGSEDQELLDASLCRDGSFLVLLHKFRDPMVWDLDTRDGSSHFIPEQALRVCLKPDGTRVALLTFSNMVKIWNLETRQFDRVDMKFSPHMGGGLALGSIVFSPVRDQIAVSIGREVTIWELIDRRQRRRQIIPVSTKGVKSLCFSADGGYLVSSCGEYIRIWEIDGGDCVRLLKAPGDVTLLRVDAVTSQILTNHGLFTIDGKLIESEDSYSADLGSGDVFQRAGFCVDRDNSWITLGCDRVLWLPPEYRPDGVAVLPSEQYGALKASVIALGCRSGRVVFLRFHSQKLPGWTEIGIRKGNVVLFEED